MHRSGTSLVANILRTCGVALGADDDLLPPQEENPEGFWEHAGFVELNEELLSRLGGAWDLPPALTPGWQNTAAVAPLRERAVELVGELDLQEPWGWKDPRNSLTLPFWRSVLPDLKVVACVRQPLEVAESLSQRMYPPRTFPLDLWLAYNRTLLDAFDGVPSLVTHYDSFFHDPEAEIRRLLDSLGLPVDDAVVTRAAGVLNPTIRHQSVRDEAALRRDEAEVASCYRELCAAAGPVYAANADLWEQSDPQPSGELELLRRAHEVLQRRVLGDRTAFAEQVQELRDEVERVSAENDDLRRRLEWREDVTAQQAEELDRRAEENAWRAEVMEQQEQQLARIYGSAMYRYSGPVRRLVGVFRRSEP